MANGDWPTVVIAEEVPTDASSLTIRAIAASKISMLPMNLSDRLSVRSFSGRIGRMIREPGVDACRKA